MKRSPGGPRIAIVEDNPLVRRALHRMLEDRFGLEVIAAVDGSDGITEVIASAPDLVLVDCRLQEQRGEAVALALAAQLLTTEIWLMSASMLHAPSSAFPLVEKADLGSRLGNWLGAS